MSTSRSTHLTQQEGKRAMKKMADAGRYMRFATRSEDKSEQRDLAAQAYAEWLTKQPRITNLSDHLRKKY
jgi:hypothetical protein